MTIAFFTTPAAPSWVEAAYQAAREFTVSEALLPEALALWASWNVDVPPTGTTGDMDADRRLADAFRLLAALRTRDEQFAWIEARLFSLNDFPPPDAPRDLYRETLTRWWLELFETP